MRTSLATLLAYAADLEAMATAIGTADPLYAETMALAAKYRARGSAPSTSAGPDLPPG